MRRFFLPGFAVFFIFYFNLHAEQINWTQQLLDSIYPEKNELKIDIEKMKLSLANGANPNWIRKAKQKRGDRSLLWHFVRQVYFMEGKSEKYPLGVEAIKLLFQHNATLQYCDKTILFFPIAGGQYEIVKLLLENGADAKSWPKHEIGSDYNFDPIEEAAATGNDQIVELLVSYGAKKPSDRNILQLRFVATAAHGSVSELKELLNQGARINEKNPSGETALMNALGGIWDVQKARTITFLLDEGADPNEKARGHFGTTKPLHFAVFFSTMFLKSRNELEYITQPEIILETLIAKGAFISGKDDDDKTPLHVAAEINNLVAAHLLLEAGAKVKPKDKYGKIPWNYAESKEMILLLKKHGATE